MDVDAVIYVVIGTDRDGNRSIGRFRDRGVRVGTQKKGILTDTLFQFSFFKPYVVAINLLPQPPYYYTKNQYLYI